MLKWLFTLAIVVVGVLLYLGKWRPRPATGTRSGTPRLAEMVRCAHCGMHLPAADALCDRAGHPYCCDAHLREGAAQTSAR